MVSIDLSRIETEAQIMEECSRQLNREYVRMKNMMREIRLDHVKLSERQAYRKALEHIVQELYEEKNKMDIMRSILLQIMDTVQKTEERIVRQSDPAPRVHGFWEKQNLEYIEKMIEGIS